MYIYCQLREKNYDLILICRLKQFLNWEKMIPLHSLTVSRLPLGLRTVTLRRYRWGSGSKGVMGEGGGLVLFSSLQNTKLTCTNVLMAWRNSSYPFTVGSQTNPSALTSSSLLSITSTWRDTRNNSTTKSTAPFGFYHRVSCNNICFQIF